MSRRAGIACCSTCHLFANAVSVGYSHDRPRVSRFDLEPIPGALLPHAGVEKLFLSKSKEWEYEREYRMVNYDGDTSVSLPDDSLVGVHFGGNETQQTIDRVSALLRNRGVDVPRYKARLHDSSFAICFDQL